MNDCDLTFDAMGCQVRLIVGPPRPGHPSPAAAAERGQRFIERFDAALSRFRSDSELCSLNADGRPEVPASDLMRRAVHAGLWAAEQTGGLVDPTLVRELESAGYARSRAGVPPVPLAEALALAPTRRPARPNPERRWRRFEVDDDEGVVRRPPGLAFDTGGSGKGLAADLLAHGLAGYSRFVVDCGGDVRIGGFAAMALPFEVQIEHPLTGERAHTLPMGSGAIATSGLNVRVWRRDEGGYAHHLIDPSTGQPAWTGLVGATAVGDTALEAETTSKAALLSGPDRARELLARRGGLIVHDDGNVELIGPLGARPRFSITVPRSVLDGGLAA
jgi:thiamine biosynthesis lipoprotein